MKLMDDAFGDGVTKDVYSYFLKELFWFRCAEIDASVPTSLTDEEAKRLRMIITRACRSVSRSCYMSTLEKDS